MRWPEAPTCHGTNAIWRPANPTPTRICSCGYPCIEPYGYLFQTCSACYSIHPDDLVHALNSGARLGGSDWKYGYPHKFYVEGIPNPLYCQLVDVSSMYTGLDHEPTSSELDELKDKEASRYSAEVFNDPEARALPPEQTYRGLSWPVHIHWRSTASPTTFAKFYTVHLGDHGYDTEAHDLLLELVSEHSGIIFTRKPDSTSGQPQVEYRAPRFGYQRA